MAWYSAWDVRSSKPALRGFIERQREELADLEAAGYANSSAAQTIKSCIDEVEKLLA